MASAPPTLDLRSPQGRELLLRLLPHFDVLVENFRPGVMEEIGLGAEGLVERFPRLVYCGISGFGADGPYRDRPGFDQIAQGMSGFMSLTGTPESGPTRAGIAIGDLLGGIFAAQGVQLALLVRERTGRGQIVNTSLLEAMIGVLSWGAGMYFETGRAPGPAGQHHPLSSPYGRFRARDGYLNIAAGNDADVGEARPRCLDRESWLTDERFSHPLARLRASGRPQRRDRAGVGRPRTSAYWIGASTRRVFRSGPVLDLEQVFADPQVLARGMLVEMPHPELGDVQDDRPPGEALETPGRIAAARRSTASTPRRCCASCGLAASEIERLREDGVI